MSAPVAYIDAAGIHRPDYAALLTWVKDQFKATYGADLYLEPDSQDGQLCAIFAEALSDSNTMAVQVYNHMSPSTAEGAGLSTVVKINGISRQVSTYSTVDLVIVGEAGAVIADGAAADDAGTRWVLPATVTIPLSGEITVTAKAADIGAVKAIPNSITSIGTPTRGWQTVNNPSAAVPGAPVEIDSALRRRQTVSTAIPATSPLGSMIGAVAAIAGVTRYAAHENDTDLTDENGIPSHNVAMIVEGGDSTLIAQTIAAKKTIGTGTHGSTSVVVNDAAGIPRTIRFSRPVLVEVQFAITLKALPGFSSARLTAIKQAIIDWIADLPLGEDIDYGRAYLPANLYGNPALGAPTFKIDGLTMRRGAGAFLPADVVIAYNETAFSETAGITITVTA